MKKFSIKFLSALLALLMALSCFGFAAFADGDDDAATDDTAAATDGTSPGDDKSETDDAAATDDKKDDSSDSGKTDDEEQTIDLSTVYLNTMYLSQEEKLYTMTLKQRAFGYELYADEYSGEIAVKNLTTGEILFSNPFDVATSPSSEAIKKQLLSQLIISFTDNTGSTTEFNSFEDASMKDQVKVKNLRNGVRVEYSMGDEEVRYLVPRLIKKERYEELIEALIVASGDDRAIRKFAAYYQIQDPYDTKLSVRAVKEMQAKYPVTEDMAVYVFDTEASARELREIEKYIKTYCPDYSYATLEEDHQITGYTATQKAPPLFKMALEYYLDEDGLQIRLPANGIRFDEDEYQLLSIRILPFFGAGANPNTGYTFLPDGSGALFCFEDLAGTAVNVTGKVYGIDYAYHEIGTVKQETMRLPVYGVVEHYKGNTAELYQYWMEDYLNTESGVFTPAHWQVGADYTPVEEDRGYFAIIEEGDALASITTTHGGSQHKYNSVYTEFYPRPTDSYRLSDSISVADNTVWTVTSKRKYTGSYKIRIIMLTDTGRAEKAGLSDGEYYECSYVGMAKAYRDYLEKNGVLKAKENVKEDIPLYIESFGALETASSFLSIPTTVKKALTTFENIRTMYDELAEAGVTNVNFRLTGFANGGMESTVPDGVKFEKSVGGNSGYKELLSYANEKGFGLFPDFDFSYAQKNTLFDGFKLKRDAVRSIDSRYTTKRIYYSSYQETLTTGLLCISPSVFANFYKGVNEDLSELGAGSISVSTLGSDLNSDFDKSEPYNREDSKELVSYLLEQIQSDYGDVMLDAGNAYTWKYADHILNVTLDSSHFNYSGYTVPFIGMVLHGYVNFAGTPTNMASDMNYETLKMLENGALPYFTLSYQNTPLLKENNTLSKYYSVAYGIWREDLVETYKELNELLRDVQSAKISNHEFLDGERVPDADEIAADKAAEEAAAAAAEAQAKLLAEKLERARKLAARRGGEITVEEPEEDEPVETTEPTETTETEEPAEPAENTEGTEEEGTGEEQTEPETKPATAASKYAVTDGSIVRVTYSNGISYILNYNRFTVTVEGYTVGPLSFVRADN